MKRSFTILTAAFMLLAFLAIPMGMMGQTRDAETFTFSELGYGNAENVTTVEGDDVTLTFDAGSNMSNSPKYYNTGMGVRMYTGNTLEIALNDQTGDTRITAIDFTFSSSSYNGGLQNWTGSETSHTFTATSNARIQVIAVTFSEGGTAPTTYTVTYYANVTGTAPVVDTYVEGADVTLRDANTFTNDGYTFSEWNTDADGDGDAYEAGEVIEGIDDDIELYAIWTENPVSDDHWVLTELADLTSSDVFVIVGNNGSNYAMSNNGGTTDAPSAVAVTVTGNEITSNVAATIQWTISGNATDGYTFYPNGSTSTWLYCTATNNGVRVGTNANKTFVIDATSGYLKHNATSRYIGIYNSTDWRCYTSVGSNIANQTFAFYKKVTGSIPPSITANNVSIAYDATSGEIEYTLNNPATNGSLSVSENVDWISNPVLSTTENKVTFTTTANEVTTAREGIITITYTYGDNETVSKDVTVTQAAAPVIYTTIPDLFAAATGTETSVLVTFNNWVVSGVSTNGKNVFVTDNNGNGFVIYYTTDMSSTFAAGNILSGTAVSCTLKKYNGFAELLNVTATDLNITSGGTVTVADIAMADLTGVNTGALLHYDNLTYSVDNNKYYLSDGTTSIQVYNAIYAFGTFVEGKHYNITGIYQQYNNTKEILPRSAEDIEEVVIPTQDYDLTVEPFENLEIITFVNDEMVMEAAGEIQVNNGDHIMLSIVADEGYVMETLMVNGVNHVNDIAADFTYEFDMPAEAVTISATAVEYVAPVGGDYVRITSLDELTDGSIVVIAARYDEEHTNGYYAMSNASSGKPTGVLFTSTTSGDNETLPASIVDDEDDYYWTVNVTENGYTFTNADGDMIGYGTSGTNFVTGGTNTEWTIESGTAGNSAMVAEYTGFVIKNKTTNSRAFAFNGSAFGPYAWSNNNAAGYNFYLDFFVQTGNQSQDNASLIAIVQINGENIEDGTDWEVKAFNQYDVCRGVGNIENGWGPITDEADVPYSYYMIMTIQGEPGDEISFKLYDLANEEEYDECDVVKIWDDNEVWGTPGDPVVLNFLKSESYTKVIEGYGDNNPGGYYLIASPLRDAVTPTIENSFLVNDYDLYRFNQSASKEWENWKDEESDHYHFDLVSGKGYLYANKVGTVLTFTGYPYNGNGEVTLTKAEEADGLDFPDWNLVGNPFTVSAYLPTGRSFYSLQNAEDFTPETGGSDAPIEAMNGVFVIANEIEETLTFSTTAPSKASKLVMNLSNNRGSFLDRAIVRFDEGGQLPKLQLRSGSTKVYIPQDNVDYAVVNSEEMGAIPVSFKAEKNGNYTLSFTTDEVSFGYLHLIDNMTGADVDLLANPSYTFEAKTTDYASRFRLVFITNNGVSESDNDTFTFFNGSNWVISNEGEATLQVIDVTGRVLSNEQINGNCSKSLNLKAGVYVIRLINANVVKTQKVVID